MIDTCLKSCGLTCADIDLYGVTTVPAALPGLRIGLAAVKGLAFPRRRSAPRFPPWKHWLRRPPGGHCALCTGCRRAQVYSAAFDLATHPPAGDDARAVADLAQFVENCKKPLFFVGDGAALCYNKYGEIPGVLPCPHALRGGRPPPWPWWQSRWGSGRDRAARGSAAGLSPPEPGRARARRASGCRGGSIQDRRTRKENGKDVQWQNPLRWPPTTAVLN